MGIYEDYLNDLKSDMCKSVNIEHYYLNNKVRRNDRYNLISANKGYIRRFCTFNKYMPKSSSKSINVDLLISKNASVFEIKDELWVRSFGLYPSRASLKNNIIYHREGGKMKMDINNNLTGYTDFYNLSCINNLYPISLTQNELVNFPINKTDELINDLNAILDKDNKLIKTDMIDHTIYHNKILCIIINKTYGLDKMIKNGKEIECLSALLTGFCIIDAIYFHSEMVSNVCKIIEKHIKDVNLISNTALKHESDIKLSDDNIQILTGSSGKYTISDLTIKNQEIVNLDYDYYPYIDVSVLIDEFNQSSDKLLILHGSPGVGKSKLSTLISHRFNKEFNYNVIMFPGRHCSIADAWTTIEDSIEKNSRNGKETLIIIDDLDPILLNREMSDNPKGNIFFNSLITLLDGVVSVGIKFIITTNHVIRKSEDSPLYRPGRLFDSILLRPLTFDESIYLLKKYKVNKNKISEFNKLDIKEYYQSFVAQFIHDTNSNIKRSYYKEENKQVTKVKTNKIGF